ncbi:PREDICTED: U7 snRNA-associated Sm-like protein LSm10 isoform X2 [Trachymyrmex septentrionalis]|uniref:U7 snRNA-associated Sm-like protein LSm10 isoform X2 n=1 Tax=Trachymyrmex septentrionalis TaxID=34720 RepID=UPI00084F8020|nr:PREDICTED: U7 snRNA-associated Sm-like protein LSm10 isoform X2 [Trachymyrmex septentrionalis]
MPYDSRREQYFLYNTLSILLKAVEKTRTTVDLRNEATIVGIVENADAYMNIVMKDCVFTDPRGDSFKYDMFFVQARNIRSVHVPMNIRIIPAIKQQLNQLSRPAWKDKKRTFKTKYAQQRQQEGLAAVEKILENRNTTKDETTKSEDK